MTVAACLEQLLQGCQLQRGWCGQGCILCRANRSPTPFRVDRTPGGPRHSTAARPWLWIQASLCSQGRETPSPHRLGSAYSHCLVSSAPGTSSNWSKVEAKLRCYRNLAKCVCAQSSTDTRAPSSPLPPSEALGTNEFRKAGHQGAEDSSLRAFRHPCAQVARAWRTA